MKIQNIILTTAALLMTFASCDKTAIDRTPVKDRIDEDALATTSVYIRSTKNIDNTVSVLLTEGGPAVTESVYAAVTRPTSLGRTVAVSVDQALVEEYNAANGTELIAYPSSYCTISGDGIMSVAAGEKVSEPLGITFSTVNSLGNTLPAGEYMLPVVSLSSEKNVVWFRITVRKPYKGHAGLYTKDDLFFVFYINTSKYDPRLVTDYYMEFETFNNNPELYTVGNIINLRRTRIVHDSGRAVFSLGADMRYVLDHYSKYITPLQEEGRKVCLSIEGGNTGLGFCNLTDEQIEDFVAQVKAVMDAYPLDGINIWDRNSGYGAEGMPAMNTTSYPKLIVALREMLGPDRLLTISDYEEPTEYFHDTEKTGGIEVGRYIDYAWSGYCDASEGFHIVDPWHQGQAGVSTKHPRRPIAGLSEAKYGVVNFPWSISANTPELAEAWDNSLYSLRAWLEAGFKQNNIILFEDLRTNLQDAQEGLWSISLIYGCKYFSEDVENVAFVQHYLEQVYTGYGKWLKDW